MYIVLETGDRFESARDAVDFILEIDDLHDTYDEGLYETYDSISVEGITFLPHEILKKCDPVAYRCYYLDWLDNIAREYAYDLERLEDGDEWNVVDHTVRKESR